MTARVARLCRYPVKGLSPQDLERVEVAGGGAIPHDRRFAIARASTPIDSANPGWLPKQKFHVLMRDAKLAQLGADYDPETTKLTLRRKGRPVSTGRLNEVTGRATLSQFFAAFLGDEARGTPKVVDAGSGTLSDQRDPVISLINLASVADLQRVTGRPVDPIRFRGNLHLEHLDAWAEWDWIGRELSIGGLRLRAVEAIERCAATEVNPETAERDLNLPKILQRGYGHVCMGLYCEVLDGGAIAVGDAVEVAA